MGKHGTGKVLKICLNCSKEFYARKDRIGRFCSKSCCSSFLPKRFLRVKKNCEVCKKEFEIKKYRINTALYCSSECRRTRMPKKENHPSWKGGISERPYKVRKIIEQIKVVINKCQKCESKDNLQGHHIVPFAERPDLGCDKNNILILCSLCHSKEHPDIENFIRR